MFCPNISHYLELKRLSRYLKHNQDRGLVLDPNYVIFKVDVYPDASFVVIYGHKNTDDPACAKKFTGFIITFDGSLIL